MSAGGSFAEFCAQHNIGTRQVKWKVLGDRSATISINEDDMKDGGLNLLSVGLNFALRELEIDADITIRETDKGVDIIVEK